MMKRNLFVLLCCLLWTSIAYSQGYFINISGRVTNATTGMGMDQQVVNIVVNDTLTFTLVYAGTQITDTAGYYAMNFTGVGNAPTGIVGVSVTDCNGAILTQTFVAFGSNITLPNVDFAICPTMGNCQAGFTASASPGSTVVQFTDASIVGLDTVIARAWYMNGDTLFTQNPSYTFPAVGTYNVCLDVTTSLGCTDYQCNNITVGTNSPSCQATLTYGQLLSGAMGLTASASGTASIVFYDFDFGDSNSIHAIDSMVPYSYPNGLYNACVDVVFADGCIAHACTLVNIGGSPNCQALFSTAPDTTQQYSLLVVNSCLGNHLQYTWDFGDGGTSTIAYPQHTYAGPGTYNICVTVVDSPATCTASYCDSVVVINKVNAPFTINVVPPMTTAVTGGSALLQGLQCYPLPADDRLYIDLQLQAAAQVDVMVLDLQGRTCTQAHSPKWAAGNHQLTMEIAQLPAGIYFARIAAGGTQVLRKLVIAH